MANHNFTIQGGTPDRTQNGSYLYDIFDNDTKVGELTFDSRGEDPAMRTTGSLHYSPARLTDLISDDKKHLKQPGEIFFLSLLDKDTDN